jgi:hypothetical protein
MFFAISAADSLGLSIVSSEFATFEKTVEGQSCSVTEREAASFF